MKNLLNKKDILLLESYLKENRVPWNRSALGLLSNAVFRPISWLSGSIKKGLKNKQIDNLIQQYGLEIVKAIKELDAGDDVVSDKSDKPKDTKKDDTESKELSTIKNGQKYLNKFKDQFNSIKKIKPNIKNLLKLGYLDQREEEFQKIKKLINNITSVINIDELYNFLENYDIPGTENYEKTIKNYKNYVKTIKESDKVSRYITNNQNLSGTVNALKGFYSTLEDLEDLYDLSILELNEQLTENKNSININGSNRFSFNRRNFNENSNSQNITKMINEVSAYKLPDDIKKLLPEENLQKIESIPNVKEKMDKVLNKVRLNTIAYEANYIIQQADKQKDELQKKWDLGIQNIKDYFQNVVDINTLPNGNDNVDSKIKNRIKSDQKQLSELQKLSITETFPVGEEFKEDKLYAIECVVTGQNNKNVRSILLISPVSSFKENVNNEDYYMFKFFGQYEYDKSIDRVNIFSKLTNNQAMVNNFKSPGNTYYLAFKNLKPSNKSNHVFVYSNAGKMFFNNDAENVDKIADKIKNYEGKDKAESLKKLEKLGNTIKIMINQRFVIEDEVIENKTYPGVTKEDLLNNQNSKNAINNHQKLLNIL